MLYQLIRAAFMAFGARRNLAIENLALRQQLAILKRLSKRPRLTHADRLFWVILSKLWRNWAEALIVVKPETVIEWHRKGFRLLWRWKSRRGPQGRPRADREIVNLIRTMARANPLWGAPRIHGELQKLGIEVSQATVSRYVVRRRRPPSQTWKSFLRNHVKDLPSVDFFTVPTATFRILYVFIVLLHDRRRVVHFNVTESPCAVWAGQQIVEAFPWDLAPRFMIRDGDQIYGLEFVRRVKGMGIREVLIAPHSPWLNGFAERLVGTIRRDCLDHVIVLGEAHLWRILTAYFDYYHRSRTHLALEKDCPEPRAVEPPEQGRIVAFPQVGGLHHRYSRLAA
jgi:putative transposase